MAVGINVQRMHRDQLPDQAAPVGGVMGSADPERAKLVVAVTQHHLGPLAAQHREMCTAPKIWLVR